MQMKLFNIILALVFLSGCTSIPFLKPQQPVTAPEPIIKTVTEYETLEIYQPPLPQEISLEDVEFFVITEKNMEEQIVRLEKMQGGTFVLFGLTPQAYENMALTFKRSDVTYVNRRKSSYITVRRHRAMKIPMQRIGWKRTNRL